MLRPHPAPGSSANAVLEIQLTLINVIAPNNIRIFPQPNASGKLRTANPLMRGETVSITEAKELAMNRSRIFSIVPSFAAALNGAPVNTGGPFGVSGDLAAEGWRAN